VFGKGKLDLGGFGEEFAGVDGTYVSGCARGSTDSYPLENDQPGLVGVTVDYADATRGVNVLAEFPE
jgi:hypothetical protein